MVIKKRINSCLCGIKLVLYIFCVVFFLLVLVRGIIFLSILMLEMIFLFLRILINGVSFFVFW